MREPGVGGDGVASAGGQRRRRVLAVGADVVTDEMGMVIDFMSEADVEGVLNDPRFAAVALLTLNHDVGVFTAVMALDNFAQAFAGVALVTYMSSLTSIGYTATQYALLSSTYAYLGKVLKGFSGSIVESLSASHGLMNAYAIFFVGAGAIGIPALILVFALARTTPARTSENI